MSNFNINKLKNFDSISAARESKVGKSGKTDSQNIQETSAKATDDSLNFSTKFGGFGRILDSLREIPDIRQDRVDALRTKISSGEYNPSGEEIANAIFKSEKV